MNQIHYRIVEIFPNDHQIKVRYFSDTLPEEKLISAWNEDGITPAHYRTDYIIDLPIPTPTEEELDKLITQICPVWWFERQDKIADPNVDTTMAALKDLVGVATPLSVIKS